MIKNLKRQLVLLLAVVITLAALPVTEVNAASMTAGSFISSNDADGKCFFIQSYYYYEGNDASMSHEQYLDWALAQYGLDRSSVVEVSTTIAGEKYSFNTYITVNTNAGHSPWSANPDKCERCGRDLPHTHTFSSAWVNNDPSGHWHAATCSHTSEKGSFATHTPGPAATETTPQTCTICGYEIAPKLHSHELGAKTDAVPGNCVTKATLEWYACANGCDKRLASDLSELASIEGEKDPSNHAGTATTWTKTVTTHKETYDCCGAVKTAEVDHTYGASGTARYTCTVCSYEDTAKKELVEAKDAAKSAIDEAVAGDTTANVVSAATTAKGAIDAATTVADVTTAKNGGFTAIQNAKITNAKAAAKAAIAAEKGSDTSENVLSAASTADANIEAATTIDGITAAKNDGITAIKNAKAVNDTTEKIDAIGTVTYTSASKEKIDAARAAYDALSDDLKSQITNIDKLTDAEKKYDSLKPKSSGSSSSNNEAPVDDRTATEERMAIAPVTIDRTLVNRGDMAVIPGGAYNLSNFVTATGIARGINAAVTASNKAGTNTATIYSGNPMCFNGTIIKAIQNGKKTVVYYFPYKGHIYSVTIPATVQARYVLERSGFAGPFYVGQQLGTTKLVK